MADEGIKAKTAERYERAAHRVQTAIAFNPDRPRDQYKDLRTGIDMRASDAAGLADIPPAENRRTCRRPNPRTRASMG